MTISTVVLAVAGCGDPATPVATAPETTTPNTAEAPSVRDVPPVDEGVRDAATDDNQAAVCKLEPIGDSKVKGTIHFEQEGDKVTLTGEVSGLKPGKHGFHVHEKGDLSDKETGKSAGGHFNPTGQKHGKPSDAERHVGDLGNVTANDDGVATLDITDTVISLNGEHSIIGKSLMIHEGEDVFTQPTGDAGGRVAFGLIEAEDQN
ncbi:superoxide dismutase family protein [Allorhodopirellula solitaria]|uniref:superoxide dismutase family protein n=1 Tax=Allorhodopirellula solitaria TaxID=2527987 RepID=UPI001FEB512C|nr:superoxide dismutase family protein [Allorhodopirellula solitaria]